MDQGKGLGSKFSDLRVVFYAVIINLGSIEWTEHKSKNDKRKMIKSDLQNTPNVQNYEVP